MRSKPGGRVADDLLPRWARTWPAQQQQRQARVRGSHDLSVAVEVCHDLVEVRDECAFAVRSPAAELSMAA